jgi:hypothetical protein
MPTFQGQTVALTNRNFSFDKSFILPRGPRNGRVILSGFRLKFRATTLTTGTGAGASGLFARCAKWIRVKDGAGDRRNLSGPGLQSMVTTMLGGRMSPLPTAIAASQSSQTVDFDVPIPFALPGLQSPDDFGFAAADFLAGGQIQVDFGAVADFPALSITSLGDMTCTLLADFWEEIGPPKLRQRDLWQEEVMSGSRSYYVTVGGNLLPYAHIWKDGDNGYTVLTDLLTVTVPALNINAIPNADIRRGYRMNSGVPTPPSVTAQGTSAGYQDQVQSNGVCPFQSPGFMAQLADYPFVADRLNIRTDETSGLNGPSVLSQVVTPMSLAGVQAQLAEAGIRPDAPLVADVPGGGGPEYWGNAWPYIRKRVA